MVIDKHHRKNARVQGVKLPAEGRASRKGSFVHIVPLDPAYKAGLAGHVPAKWSRVLVGIQFRNTGFRVKPGMTI